MKDLMINEWGIGLGPFNVKGKVVLWNWTLEGKHK